MGLFIAIVCATSFIFFKILLEILVKILKINKETSQIYSKLVFINKLIPIIVFVYIIRKNINFVKNY